MVSISISPLLDRIDLSRLLCQVDARRNTRDERNWDRTVADFAALLT